MRFRNIVTDGKHETGFIPDRGLKVSGPHQDWLLPVNEKGHFLRSDGSILRSDRRIVSANGKEGNAHKGFNYFYLIYGLDGTGPKTRTMLGTKDRGDFTEDFVERARTKLEFPFALHTRTNEFGFVTLPYRGRIISIPAVRDGRKIKTNYANSRIILFPVWVMNNPIIFTLPSPHGKFIGEFDFNPQLEIPYYNQDGTTTYIITPRRENGLFQAAIPDQTIILGERKRKREAGEVYKVAIKNGRQTVNPFISSGGQSRATIETIPQEGSETVVVTVGSLQGPQKTAVEKKHMIKVHKDKRKGVYIFFFDKNYSISKNVFRRHGIDIDKYIEKEKEFEVGAINGKAVALIDHNQDKPVRIPLIMDWLWNGEDFVLDHTTSSDLHTDKMTGCRVLEQTESKRYSTGEYLVGADLRKIIVPRTPWKTNPLPIATLVINAKEVPFFASRKSGRLTKGEWEIVELIIRAREGTLLETPNPDQASEKAERARKLRKQAEIDILDIKELEQVCKLYLEAFSLDPKPNSEYLSAAMEIRRLIISRKRHLSRQKVYLKWANDTFSPRNIKPETHARVMVRYFGEAFQNHISVAYVLETLAGLACGKYKGDQTLFQEVFAALPYVFRMNPSVGQRTMLALKILSTNSSLSFIPRWILNHPPQGVNAVDLFKKGRRRNNIEDEPDYEINWEELAPPKPEPKTSPPTIKPVFQITDPDAAYKDLLRRHKGMKINDEAAKAQAGMILVIVEKTIRARGGNGNNGLGLLRTCIKAFITRMGSDSY